MRHNIYAANSICLYLGITSIEIIRLTHLFSLSDNYQQMEDLLILEISAQL